MAVQAIAYLKIKSGIRLGKHDEESVTHSDMFITKPLGVDPMFWPGDYRYLLAYVVNCSYIRMRITTDDIMIYDGDVKKFTPEAQSRRLKQCINCRYYEPYVDLDMDSHCMSPGVTGERSLSSKSSPRREGGECGEDRKLWEIR